MQCIIVDYSDISRYHERQVKKTLSCHQYQCRGGPAKRIWEDQIAEMKSIGSPLGTIRLS